jgi:hypothetical protein
VALQTQNSLKPDSFKIIVDGTHIAVRARCVMIRATASHTLQAMHHTHFAAAMARKPHADVWLIHKM